MQSIVSNRIRKVKVAVLSVVAYGMMYGSACTLGDIGLNVVNGTLSFVKGYTTDWWEEVFPEPGEVTSIGDDE